MFKIISSIQDMLLSNKIKKLHNLTYKNLTNYHKPENLPFNYFILEPPPSNDSEQTKHELDEVIKETLSRNETSINTILTIDKDALIIYRTFFANKKINFPEEEFAKLYNILFGIIKELKLFYNRPRPNQIAEFYNVNIDVINTQTHSTPSYPSGHVAYAKLAELLASEMYPDYATQFRSFTNKVSQARIKQGVHFRSDNEASIKLVDAICSKLKELSNER
jgi:hypothetical protein